MIRWLMQRLRPAMPKANESAAAAEERDQLRERVRHVERSAMVLEAELLAMTMQHREWVARDDRRRDT